MSSQKYFIDIQILIMYPHITGDFMGISYKPLWKLLIDKNLKKTDLLEIIPISPTTLAKLSKNKPVDGKIFEKLCAYFDCQPSDIMEYVKDSSPLKN